MTNIKDSPEFMNTTYGKIMKVNEYKYFEEIIQLSVVDKEANRARSREMEIEYQLTKDLHNNKNQCQ